MMPPKTAHAWSVKTVTGKEGVKVQPSQDPKQVIFAEISQSLACSPATVVGTWADHLQDFRLSLARAVRMVVWGRGGGGTNSRQRTA